MSCMVEDPGTEVARRGERALTVCTWWPDSSYRALGGHGMGEARRSSCESLTSPESMKAPPGSVPDTVVRPTVPSTPAGHGGAAHPPLGWLVLNWLPPPPPPPGGCLGGGIVYGTRRRGSLSVAQVGSTRRSRIVAAVFGLNGLSCAAACPNGRFQEGLRGALQRLPLRV